VNPNRYLALLKDVASGRTSAEQAYSALKHLPFARMGDVMLDTHRSLRKGIGEIIYGEGKTAAQLQKIVDFHLKARLPFLITRLCPEKYKRLKARRKGLAFHPAPGILQYGRQHTLFPTKGKIAIISAGASDLKVAEEVRIVVEFFGQETLALYDRGVAGIHRLLKDADALRDARVIVVAAGMEGALPSVVAGMFEAPVIGVPTSVGYGTNLGGFAPLLTMLNSCTAGVAVVGIDNGVAAGYLATLINRA